MNFHLLRHYLRICLFQTYNICFKLRIQIIFFQDMNSSYLFFNRFSFRNCISCVFCFFLNFIFFQLPVLFFSSRYYQYHQQLYDILYCTYKQVLHDRLLSFPSLVLEECLNRTDNIFYIPYSETTAPSFTPFVFTVTFSLSFTFMSVLCTGHFIK